MRRREFLGVLGSAAAALPVRAQTRAVPVIGFLNTASAVPFSNFVAAFQQGLKEAGFVEGQNLAIEYRWAESQLDRLPALAGDLVRRSVSVIVTTGATASALAAKSATSSIPILFIAGDPIKDGLVASLNRPGGNLTGVTLFTNVLSTKRLELLRELVPNARLIAVLADRNSREADAQLRELQVAARSIRQEIFVALAGGETEFESAFSSIAQQRAVALLVAGSPYFTSRRDAIVAQAARHAIPAIYEWREFTEAGGLISYGTSLPDSYRQLGLYAGRIIKGEKPGDLPVVQPTRFELAINSKTARALGLTVPPTLLARADEVIE
jgi:putative ABC transport system substrate-binding protein